jgi:hypothetical protein
MERLALAHVPADMPLSRAFSSFRKNTRGLVVKHPEGSYLVTAGDIADAWNQAADAGKDPATVPVGSIARKHRYTETHPLPLQRPARAAVKGFAEHEQSHFRTAFQGLAAQYTFQYLAPRTAVVVTSTETFADGLQGGVVICTCAGNPVHRFERRQLVDPTHCNKPHGVPVTCQAIND